MAEKSKGTTIRGTFPFKDMQVWQRFVLELKRENRFSLSEEPSRFVDLLLEYAGTHKVVALPERTVLFRARINDREGDRNPVALENMGMPPAHLAGHGRLNPRGIPYLYLASDQLTAVSEVRPWIGAKITVAAFSLEKECRFINFSKRHMVNIPKGKEFEGPEFTWRELITWMFSAPFDPRDDTAYIPTQFLAERIKGAGFDGIIYDSALGTNGYNVTMFKADLVASKKREQAEITALKLDAKFRPVDDAQG